MNRWTRTLFKNGSKFTLKSFLSTSTACHGRQVYQLPRSVIRVQGSDSMDFLQGLMTNDVQHLEQQPSIYSLFLNTQGRILFDTFVVKNDSEGHELLIDCDHHVAGRLVKHLKMFKVRRKLDISLQEHQKVWAANESIDDGLCYQDSRCNHLGWRVIAESLDFKICDIEDYQLLRFQQGIPEGSLEIPPGKCTPLEYNVEYMHGVSFHKGCYIGQELTARTHHTGVIRKRIMPLSLSSPAEIDAEVVTEKGKKVGTVRGQCGTKAIGLIRLQHSAEKLNINGDPVQVHIPDWWPKSAPKSPQNR